MKYLIDHLPDAIGSTHISDALDSYGYEGGLQGIRPMVGGKRIIGPLYTVRYEAYAVKPKTFQNAGTYIDSVPSGAIILIDNAGRNDCTVWGGILTHVAQLRNIQGTIINGVARDSTLIRSLQYPVFSKGCYMRSGKNRVYLSDKQCQLAINQVSIASRDWVIADDDGVVVIPIDHIDRVLERAVQVHKNEMGILGAVENGETLLSARIKFNYSIPWVSKHN